MARTASTPVRPARTSRPAETGLDDAEAAGGDGDQADDPGHRVGQQDQRGPGVGAHGPDGEQQAQVVEQQAAGGEQGGLPPLLAEHRADQVALLQEPVRETGDRLALPQRPVADRLGRPARPSAAAVSMAITMAPNPTKRTKPIAPMMAASTRPRADRGAEQDGRQDEHREGQQAADAEEREGGETADRIGGVHAADRQHPELHRGTGGGPSGHDQRDGVAGQLGGDHREPRLGAQGDALEGEGAGEVGPLGQQGGDEPQQVEGHQPGPRVEHRR